MCIERRTRNGTFLKQSRIYTAAENGKFAVTVVNNDASCRSY